MFGPRYSIVRLDLTSAGSQDFAIESDYFHIVRAEDAGGGLALDVEIEVTLGTGTDHYVPLGFNCAIEGRTKHYKLRWAAQAGVVATLLFGWKDAIDGGIRVFAPPAKQLVTSASGTALAVAAVTVGTSATLLAAANSSRQALTIMNNGTATIYLGGSGVTTASGLPVTAGQGFVVEGTTAALYAISGTAGQDVRVMEES